MHLHLSQFNCSLWDEIQLDSESISAWYCFVNKYDYVRTPCTCSRSAPNWRDLRKGAPWPEERDSHHCCLLPQLWRRASPAAGHYRDWIMLSHGAWCLNYEEEHPQLLVTIGTG